MLTPHGFTPRSDFVRTIIERGYLHQCTDLEALDAKAAKGEITGYVGFDATADSLHVGHMVQIMLLRRLQQTGHKAIALMGGGTTKIGDPSGKDESRKILSHDDIQRNLASIQRSFSGYLRFGAMPGSAVMVNNADWLEQLNYIDFLRDYGQHFSINRMLGFDSVKLRLEREQTLSFLEFNYMIFQAYDFLELARRFDCTLQMGGSDQWGNIVNGIELARRTDGLELTGLTAPLIMTSAGTKMGKTATGAIWLDPAKLSPYDFWQHWRNTADADVERFLKLFTDLPMSEIVRLGKLQGAEINDAKIVLASEATRLCHGELAAMQAATTARQTFEEGMAGDGLPEITLSAEEVATGVQIADLLHRAGLAPSKSAARRLISGNGAKLNDRGIETDAPAFAMADFRHDGTAKLSAGKKKHVIVRLA